MTSMSRHFLDRRKLLSQLCKTLHFCILKCMFSTYSGLEVIAANGCIFKNLYLAMCHDDTSVISLHHFFRTGNGNPLLGNSEILLKKQTNTKSSTAHHIRDIRNLCGADMVVYEKQTKCLWFSLWNFPLRWKLKQSHNVFWFIVRQLPQTHAWLVCWQCRTIVKFIYSWHRWNIHQPFEFNIINDIYMQNTHMALPMNTRQEDFYNTHHFCLFSYQIFWHFYHNSDVQLSCINSLACSVTSWSYFPWWAGENIPAAKQISSFEKKPDWRQDGIMPKWQLG